MGKIYKDITKTIGNTPIVKINNLSRGLGSEILVKLESFNPASSVKDRISVSMIEEAERTGKLNEDSVIIEPTSGNTGIGLSLVAAAKGYRIILTMPESMSIERRQLLQIFGAEIVLTPAAGGMKGAIEKAEELVNEIPNGFMPQQFINPANPEIHRQTTAKEIMEDTEGNIDIFISGIGTGGTITGVGEVLKKNNPEIKIIGLEPDASPILSGGAPGPHKIQGIGAGFVPGVLNVDIIDEVIRIKDKDAKEMSKRLAKEEGIFVGLSSGAAMWAALEVANRPELKGKTILALLPDTGERYLSVWNVD